MESAIRVDLCYSWLPLPRPLKKLGSRQAYSRELVDVMRTAMPKDLASSTREFAGQVPEGEEFLWGVPVGVSSVTKSFGPEFEARKQAVDVRHTLSNLGAAARVECAEAYNGRSEN